MTRDAPVLAAQAATQDVLPAVPYGFCNRFGQIEGMIRVIALWNSSF